MPVARRPAPRPCRHHHSIVGCPFFCRHFNEWCAVPLRLGSAATHFSVIVTGLKYTASYDDKLYSGRYSDALTRPTCFFLLFACAVGIAIALLGVWTGRTLRYPALNLFHILCHCGGTGYSIWFWQTRQPLVMLYPFFYGFTLVPSVIEVISVVLSVRRGLD